MKSLLALASIGLSAFSASAFAQAALPAGLYEINGTVTAVTGSSCPLFTNRPVTGHIYYPGVGHDTMQILMESVVPGQSVTFELHYAFPPVPSTGLNGWSASSPVSPDYLEYKNGKAISNGEPSVLFFNLAASATFYLPFAQGTITVKTNDDTGSCSETVQALFTRLAPFNEVKG